MKKIILFLLALIYAIPIEALNCYTDYQFIGYVEEAKENDELYKYEPVTFNKYYRLVEQEIGYYEKDSIEDYSSIDIQDKISEEVTSLTPDKEKNATYEIAIEAPNNIRSSSLSVLNIKDYEKVKIKEIEMYSNNNKISVNPMITNFTDEDYENYTPLPVNRFELYYTRSYINKLSIVIYYENDENVEFQLHLKGQSDSQYFDKDIILNKDFKKVTINIMNPSNFNDFKLFNNLEGESIVQYYKYTTNKYMHYNWKREYLIDDEEGLHPEYEYDPIESYTMYKEYKRDLLIESDDSKKDDTSNLDDNENKEEETEPSLDKTETEDKTDSELIPEKPNEENDEKPIEQEETKPQKPIVIVRPSNPPKVEPDITVEDNVDIDTNEDDRENVSNLNPIDKKEENTNEPNNIEFLKENNDSIINTEKQSIQSYSEPTIIDIIDKIEENNNDESNNDENNNEKKYPISSQESYDCKNTPSAFSIVGIILIFISLILDIIYFINVKKKKE